MLEQLFGSKTRVKLLRLFFSNPDRPYYVRELARTAGTQINSIRRELSNLNRMGIIEIINAEANGKRVRNNESQAKGAVGRSKTQKKYYKANADFLLFADLKSLIVKAQVLLEKNFVKKIEQAGNFYFLLLTGGFTGAEDVDTDILMVGRISKNRIKKLIKSFEKDFNKEINYTIMDKDEFEYRMDITDRFLYDILDSKKIIIVDKRM